MTTLAERIVTVRKRVNKRTQDEFAVTLGLGRASVANWERGGHVTGDNLMRIADQEKVSLEWLKDGVGSMTNDRNSPTPSGAVRTTGGEMAAEATALPIFATHDTGEGRMGLTKEIVDYTTRPSILRYVDDAFGIKVSNERMSPSFRSGDVALVHPRVPYIRGREVWVSDDNGVGIIATLVDYDAKNWTVETTFPATERLSLARAEWTKCSRIVGRHESA
jgi:phage repressor protein C with HTH and peptisase S24 domain